MSVAYRSSRFEWNKSDLAELVTQGVLTQNTEVIEHVAIHPYWLSNPLQGISEDFDRAISTWRNRLEGYLVSYEDVRRETTTPAMMSVDQPWIHLDVRATFYVYKPAVGQVIQAVVRKTGDTAAVCLVLHCFALTVDPSAAYDMTEWNPGTLLEVEITAFEKRGKAPILRGTCLRVLDIPSTYYKEEGASEDYWGYPDTPQLIPASVPPTPPMPRAPQDFVLNISVPKSKKTKRNTITKFQDSDEDTDLSPADTPALHKTKTKSKSKKRKQEESPLSNSITPNEPPKSRTKKRHSDSEPDSFPEKHRKSSKKKKIKVEVE